MALPHGAVGWSAVYDWLIVVFPDQIHLLFGLDHVKCGHFREDFIFVQLRLMQHATWLRALFRHLLETTISSLRLLGTRWSKSDFWTESQESKSRLGVCDQVRFKAAYPATETGHNLESLAEASIDIIFSIQPTRKAQIKLRFSTVWSAPVLFEHNKTYFLKTWRNFAPSIFGHCMEGV